MRQLLLASSVCSIALVALNGCDSTIAESSVSQAPKMEKMKTGTTLDLEPVNVRGISRLLEAVNAGDEKLVRELLDAGAKPDASNVARSPLVSAIMYREGREFVCQIGIVKALLDHGADPNRQDPMIGSLPIQDALEIGAGDCAEMLIEHGSNTHRDRNSAFKVLVSAVKGAIKTGNVALIDRVIGWGVDPNAQDPKTGYSALTQAIVDDSVELARALISRGTNPCIREADGNTALDVARYLRRSTQLIAYLESVTHCTGA
jgi:ankyrin repeat protein